MAYHICSSPSSLFHDPHYLCSSPKQRPTSLPQRLQLRNQQNSPLLVRCVSLQDIERYANAKTAEGRTGSGSKSYIWVNPKSPRATRLRQRSYDSRYTSLVKIAEALDCWNPNEGDVSDVLSRLGDSIFEQDAVVILNNMSNPDTAVLALRHFQRVLKSCREVILYNVTMKVFRKARVYDKAEKLFDEMLERGVQPDNVTFCTLISCARVSALPGKAVEWFEKMPSFGCNPDNIIYPAMIDAYGRSGNIDMALTLYDRARAEKWKLDIGTFSTLIKIYGMSGNFDGCLNVYEEMKALGMKPNMTIYNTLLDAMGRAKRPWQAKSIYKEMIDNGLSPNFGTYASLLRAYGRGRYGEDALIVYREMKEAGLHLNATLYNTLLSMCADVGFVDEAVEIFEDMKNSGNCKPDSWTFSSLVTIYSCSSKVSEAERCFNEMVEAGFQPNIFVLTSLIQCYGKAQRTDDVVRTFHQLFELGITPDDRFCGCLLNVMTLTPREELSKLIDCVEKANPKLGHLVKILVDQNGEVSLKNIAHELFDSIGSDVKKAYLNCLMDLCVNLNLLEKACELLELGLSLEIYNDIQSRSPTQWSLHLKSLSLGAALTALHVWIKDLSELFKSGEELPPLLGINTGHGKHKYSDKGLATTFESHLKELNAPFHEAPDKAGWFLTTNIAASSWLESRNSAELVAAEVPPS